MNALNILEEVGGLAFYRFGEGPDAWRVYKPIAESPIGRTFDYHETKRAMERLFRTMGFFGDDFRDLVIRDFAWYGGSGCFWHYKVEAVVTPMDTSAIFAKSAEKNGKARLETRYVAVEPSGILAVSSCPIDRNLFARAVSILDKERHILRIVKG